jgi:Zn-dependent protease with chaperone function
VIEFNADYFDGRSAARRAVRVRASATHLHVSGEGIEAAYRIDETTVDTPLARLQRVLTLPDGAELHTADHAAIDSLFGDRLPVATGLARLESRWSRALIALGVVGVCTWAFMVFGVPLVARPLAALIPAGVERSIGRQALATLDGALCDPSALAEGEIEHLRMLLERVLMGLDIDGDVTLQARNCKAIGANALALPGGTVVVTDALATLAMGDEALIAVLAHEVGHIERAHAMRMTVQTSLGALLVATVMGDAAAITSLAYTLPTLLLNSGYSRAMETEADEFAYERLRALGLSTAALGDALEALVKSHGKREGTDKGKDDEKGAGKGEGNAGGWTDYLSSHPAVEERIRRARSGG